MFTKANKIVLRYGALRDVHWPEISWQAGRLNEADASLHKMKQHTAHAQSSSSDELAGPLWYGAAVVSWSEQSKGCQGLLLLLSRGKDRQQSVQVWGRGVPPVIAPSSAHLSVF